MTDLVLIRKIQLSDITADDLLHHYGNAAKYVDHYMSRAEEITRELHEIMELVNSRTVYRYRQHTIVLDNHPLVSLQLNGDTRMYCDLYDATDSNADPIMVRTVTELYAFLIFTYPA